MSIILAIETATSSCSAALRINGEVHERSQIGNNVHSAVLLSMVESLLAQAGLSTQQLDAVAVGQGPGSFTGLRIGVGVGQGIAFGVNCPMIGVSSLDALALQSARDGRVVAMLDARMGEVYWAEYEKDGANVEMLGAIDVSQPCDLVLSSNCSDASIIGNAWDVYSGQSTGLTSIGSDRVSPLVYPSASALSSLAEEKYKQKLWVSASEFAPIYVRNNVAKKSTKKLPGRRVD